MIMIMISLLGLGLTGVAIVYALMKPHLSFFIVLFMLVSSAWAADVLSKNHVGISRVGQERKSIRQDSTSHTRIMYFGNNGYYSRHHTGGGLMGGK